MSHIPQTGDDAAGRPSRPVESILPLEVAPEQTEPLSRADLARWVWIFLGLGVLARVVRYALCFPLWEDEAFLSVNFLQRGYLDLVGSLEHRQVCPVLFLWVQLSLVNLLGFNEYTLRLFAFTCGLAELFLFRHLAGRLLRGVGLLVAVAIFAVAYPMIRYSAEAKPYGSDLFVSLVLMTFAVEWWYRPSRAWWLWALAAAAPLAVGLSYPVVFVAGMISLLVACLLWARRGRWGWAAWAVYNLLLVGSFVGQYAFSARHQENWQMSNFYRHGFPPLTEPLKFMVWLVDIHTSDLLAYPFGGHHGASLLTFICCAVGVGIVLRRRQWLLALFCLGPLALNFIAAAMHRYPYGQMVKLQLYLAPVFCMLAGLGAAAIVLWRRGGRPAQRKPLLVLLWLLAAFGLGSIGRDIAFQAKSLSTQRYRDFARWFWSAAQFDGEIVCLKTDLGVTFSPESYAWGFSALYLCNQRIYSPRHAREEPPRWDLISPERPLRCIEYYSSHRPYDHQAAAAWLAHMCAQYQLVSRERLPFLFFDKRNRELRFVEYVEIYKFIPKPTGAANTVPTT